MNHPNLLIALAWVLLLLSGCSTTSERKAYQTLAVTQNAVEVAEATFRILNANGEISASDYDKVAKARTRYQLAMTAAIELAQQDFTQITPPKAFELSLQLIQLIERLDQ